MIFNCNVISYSIGQRTIFRKAIYRHHLFGAFLNLSGYACLALSLYVTADI